MISCKGTKFYLPTSRAFDPCIPCKLVSLKCAIICLTTWARAFLLGCFLDLKKAFDTVHHEVLIKKLISIGVQGRELDWFSSYLTERYQVTKVNDHHSNKAPVNFGVPQGSILGPLLFTLYINDLPGNIKSRSSRVFLYADDTAIFVKGKSIDVINTTLNTELAHVSQWLQSNYLTLNVKKKKKKTNPC